MRRAPHQQPSKERKEGWQKYSEGLQGCRAELLLGLRPQTRNSRSRRQPSVVELVRERWVRWFYNLLHAKSPTLDPNIAKGLGQWPENMPLEDQPMMQEVTGAIRLLANGKAGGPDGVSVKFFKTTPSFR